MSVRDGLVHLLKVYWLWIDRWTSGDEAYAVQKKIKKFLKEEFGEEVP